jgi:hypothetical protein
MSGSGDGSVKVTISADSSAYQRAMERGWESSTKFQEVLQSLGGDLRKLTPEMLGIGNSTAAMANAISKATASAREAAVTFNAFSSAGLGVDTAFKSAADSAMVFVRALNPTPLQSLRTLMGSDVPTAVKVMTRTLQENIDAANGFSNAIKSAEESARVFEQALNPAPLQQMRTLMAEGIPAAAHGSGSAMSGITRELIVLGHEGLQGNWTRIPGSLLVLSEYAGGVRTAIGNMISSFTLMQGIGVGAVLAVAAAFVTLIYRAHEATLAINEATNAATMQGRSPAQARSEMAAYGAQMKDTGVMGATAIAQVSSAISQLGELTDAQKSKIAGVGTALFLNWGSDAKKTGEEVAQIFASTSSLDSYLQKQHLLSTDQMTAWAGAKTAAEKYDIGIAAITNRLGPLNSQIKTMQQDASANLAAMMAGVETPGAGMALQGSGSISGPKHLGDFEPGTKQADPGAAADTAATIEGNKHLQEKATIVARLEAQQRDLARATLEGNTAEAGRAQTAIAATTVELELWKAAGDTTWEAKQQGALNAILVGIAAQATSSKQLAIDENQARLTFWQQQATTAGLTEGQITTAKANATRARLSLTAEELRGTEAGVASWLMKQQAALSEQLVVVAANAKSSKSLAEDENRTRIAFWAEAAKQAGLTEKEITAARAEGNRARLALAGEELRGGESAAKQALAAKLATLSEEQAANHDNFAKVMAIEAQKLALLKAAGSSETKQYEQELAKQDGLQRQHAAQMVTIAETALAQQRQADTAAFAARKSELADEVTEHTITKQQEIATLRAFAAQQHALELQGLTDTLATIDAQLPAYRKLYDQIGVLKAQWLAQDKKLNAEATADLKSQWDKATAPVSSAIDGQIGAMLRGTQTISQSVAKMAQNIVIGYAEMGAKAALSWAGNQLFMLAFSKTIEAGKVATAASGAAARTAISGTETASENAGLLVRIGRWIATQLGITGATAAGATAREGVLTAEQIASVNATGVAARLSVAAAAAVAAAWAFADSAMLGPPGLAAAPGVATAAEASVMLFQTAIPSLAVGAWNVPQDMGANLHAGEMVIPANFASGLRGSGGGGDTHLNYSPTVNGGGSDPGSMRAQAGMIKSYLWHASRNGALRLQGR